MAKFNKKFKDSEEDYTFFDKNNREKTKSKKVRWYEDSSEEEVIEDNFDKEDEEQPT